MAAEFKDTDCNVRYGNKPESDYPLNLPPHHVKKMAVMMKWLSFITFFSLNPTQFISGGVALAQQCQNTFPWGLTRHGVHGGRDNWFPRLLLRGWGGRGGTHRDKWFFYCKWQCFVFGRRGGGGGVQRLVNKSAWLLLAHFNSAHAGACLIAGAEVTGLYLSARPRPLPQTHTHCADISQVLRE